MVRCVGVADNKRGTLHRGLADSCENIPAGRGSPPPGPAGDSSKEQTDEREPGGTSGRGTDSVGPRRPCSQGGALRPEYSTDVRDAPGGGGIWENGWLEGDMGGNNRRRSACGDRNPPSRRARDCHLCDQRSCQDALG